MKRILLLPLALCATLACAQHAHHAPPAETFAAPRGAARPWTQQPLLMPARNARGERASALLLPQNIAVTSLTVFAPDGPPERQKVDYPVGPEGARIEAAGPKIGNYHWVIAREETPEEVRIASTAWYFSNPGDSPKQLLREPKHELEIVPEPLPREHSNYRESEKWRFLVRFMGEPLPHQPLVLETAFGSKSTVLTDAKGIATVLFPRDFRLAPKPDEGEGHGPRRAPFVLSTVYEADGRRFITAFNATYSPDPDRSRSLGWGAVFGLVGMLAATPLLRRRPQGQEAHHA